MAIGRGLEDAGSVVQQQYNRSQQQALAAQQVIQQHAQKTQYAEGDNALQAAQLDATSNPQTGAFTKQGKAAFGLDQQYLPQFQERAQAIIDSAPDPQVRQQLQLQAQKRATELASQLDAHELHQHQLYAEDTFKAAVSLAQQGAASNFNHPDIIASNLDKVDGALDQLSQQQGWSPEELEEQRHQAHVQFHQGVLTSMLADNKPDLAHAYLDSFRSELKPEEAKLATQAIQAGESKAATDSIMSAYQTDTALGAQRMTALAQSNLTQDQQFQVVQEVERQRNALLMQRRQNPRVMQQLTTLEDSVASGQPSPTAFAQIDSLWHSGAVSDEQRLSLRGQIDRLNTKSADDTASLAWFRNAYTNSQPLSPEDSDVKKGVDSLFQDMTATTPAGTSAWTNRAVDITQRTGVVPKSATEWATANLVSGKPDDAATAADLLARIGESNPRAYAFVDQKTRVLADTINNAVQAGTDPAIAVQIARQNAALPKAELDNLKERWDSNGRAAEKGQPNALTGLLKDDPAFKPGLFSSVPTVPPAMQGEFDDLTRSYYNLTNGNLPQARELATRDLKRTWGVTEVNGKREIMQYAPEAMFPGLSAQVVRDDVADTVQKNPQAFQRLDPATGKLVDATPAAADVRLIPTDRTARTNGVEWSLGAPDEFGALDILRGADGNPIVYRLPVTPNDYGAVRARMAQGAIAKARQEQQTHAAVEEALSTRGTDELLQ